jgi:hypothetical protein
MILTLSPTLTQVFPLFSPKVSRNLLTNQEQDIISGDQTIKPPFLALPDRLPRIENKEKIQAMSLIAGETIATRWRVY